MASPLHYAHCAIEDIRCSEGWVDSTDRPAGGRGEIVTEIERKAMRTGRESRPRKQEGRCRLSSQFASGHLHPAKRGTLTARGTSRSALVGSVSGP